MKISHFLLLGLGLVVTNTFSQTKAIDVEAYRSWERLEEFDGKSCLLSANGNYVLFKKNSESYGAITILKNISSGIEKRFRATSNELSFGRESKFAFRIGRDSLAIFDSKKGTFVYLTGVKRFFIIPSSKGDKVAYFTLTPRKKSLIICNSNAARIKELADVNDYWLHKQGVAILTKGTNGLTYTDLRTFNQTIISSNVNIEGAGFNEHGDEIAYISKYANREELSYANVLTGESKVLIDSSSSLLKDKWSIEPNELSFDNLDGNIFFKLSKATECLKIDPNSIINRDLNIWSYKDKYLQNDNNQSPFSFTAMVNIKTAKLVRLESDALRIENQGKSKKYFILTTRINKDEFYWNNEKMLLYLFSVATGQMRLIKASNFPGILVVGMSSNDKNFVWFDGHDGNYYSYHLESQKISNISGFTDNTLRALNQRSEDASLIFNCDSQNGQYWMTNGKLIVHSRKDIWELDPAGDKKPINLTNGYGEKHDIRFELVGALNMPYEYPLEINKKEFLISAFHNRSKQNGFWKVNIGKSADPIKLVMSDDAYFFSPQSVMVAENSAEDPSHFRPERAFNKNVFVIRRMNSSNAPNLYSTTDFKKFKLLSDIKLDKEYIGVKSKLITYCLPGGKKAEGILHVPENLDVTKKYPMIFNYYERRSEGLNLNRMPALSGHNINIPWYISRGYLVFEPDFYYERGETAKSVIDAIKSAIEELSTLSYVDTARMGAQGQSFGGYESNILAIQTNLFKAVCAMAGPTNIISEYGSVRPGGHNNQSSADRGQRNLGAFPWQRPEVFIKNSPNFHIEKANTPLLLVHNKADDAILFSQAMELYLGMRRINKKIWLLEYDKEGHEINEPQNKLDFTIRMQQFFDHYLKGDLAPRWMTRGVPAAMKGFDSGLELDMEIKTPGEGIARPVEKGAIF